MAATATREKTYHNYIGGEWAPSASRATTRRTARRGPMRILGHFQASDTRDVDRAMGAAREAFDGWRKTAPVARGNILYKASQIIDAPRARRARSRRARNFARRARAQPIPAWKIARRVAAAPPSRLPSSSSRPS